MIDCFVGWSISLFFTLSSECLLLPITCVLLILTEYGIAFPLINFYFCDEDNGYTKEEMKVTWECRKICGLDDDFPVRYVLSLLLIESTISYVVFK